MATTLLEQPTTAPVQPQPATPAPHILGPLTSGDEYVWHIAVSHAGQRYRVRVAHDPRPDADRGTTDVCISPSTPLDVGTAVLRAAYHAAVDMAETPGRRWSLLYGALASKLAWYQDVRDAGIREWG